MLYTQCCVIYICKIEFPQLWWVTCGRAYCWLSVTSRPVSIITLSAVAIPIPFFIYGQRQYGLHLMSHYQFLSDVSTANGRWIIWIALEVKLSSLSFEEMKPLSTITLSACHCHTSESPAEDSWRESVINNCRRWLHFAAPQLPRGSG